MTFETGTLLERYEILSQLGAGGMGEVYLARDTILDRKVALKILPSDVASNQARMRRFQQEARAAAALNHPAIAHIYEIGETNKVNFIAMEFIDGVTLRETIHREGTELRKLLRYLQHVAEGLAKAHAAGNWMPISRGRTTTSLGFIRRKVTTPRASKNMPNIKS